MRYSAIVAGLFGLIASSSAGYAAPVYGTFSGELTANDLATFEGTIFGVSASDFHVGDKVSGKVTYDPALMTQGGLPSVTQYYGSPVKFSFTIGTHHFKFGAGNGDNITLLGENFAPPFEQYSAQALNLFHDFDAAVALIVGGAGLYATSLDLNSVNFQGVPGEFDFARSYVDPLTSGTTTLGAFTIQITASVPVTIAPTPIPASLPLLIGAIGGLGFVGWWRRRAA